MNLREITNTAQGTDSALTSGIYGLDRKITTPQRGRSWLCCVFVWGERRDYGRKDPQKFVAAYHHDYFGGHIIDRGRHPIRDLRPAKECTAL